MNHFHQDSVEHHRAMVAQRQAKASRLGQRLDVLTAAGIIAGRPPVLGSARDTLVFELDQERHLAAQKTQFAVGCRCSVALPDGKRLGPGDPVTLEMLDPGPDAPEGVSAYSILSELRRLRVLSAIDQRTAFERSLPPDVQYAAFVELKGKGGRVIPPGSTVSENDFPPLPPPKKMTVAEEAAAIVMRQLGRPSGPPPPVSQWQAHLANGDIIQNPRYQPRRSR